MAISGPDTTSSDFDAMQPYWTKVQAILDGQEAVRAREDFLPRFPRESEAHYQYRRQNSKFTNIFRDIVENLAAKPFSKQLDLKDDSASARVKELCEDIDGRGNHLHVFASNTFFRGIAKAVDWILVDHTKVPAGATVAEEKKLGARPYWVHIPAERLIAIYSDYVGGIEVITHARILETGFKREGFEEKEVERVRVFNREPILSTEQGQSEKVVGYEPATFQVYEKEESKTSRRKKSTWKVVEEGQLSIELIPLVPFSTARREDGTWRFQPPLRDAADLQIEHYQQETDLKMVRQLACYPTLTGNGVDPPVDKEGNPVEVSRSPGVVLYTRSRSDGGTPGKWEYIEPSGSTLTFGAQEVAATEKQLRELGRQPLTAGSGNITVVTSAVASQKSSSAVQMWALALKDALELALKITCMWMKESREPEIEIHTDFAIELENGSSMERLIKMREKGDLSQRTLWAESKRRGDLSAEFDPEAEEELLANEGPSLDEMNDILAANTDTPPDGDDPPEDGEDDEGDEPIEDPEERLAA